MKVSLFLVAVALLFCESGARSDAAAPTVPLIPYTVPEILKRVPPLRHDNQGRLPMITWPQFRMADGDNEWEQGHPLPPEAIRELLKRGFTQWIPPDEKYIPYALALQAAGAPVIIMQGGGGNGPGGDNAGDLHLLPANFTIDGNKPGQGPHYPCPLLLDGWAKRADGLRATFAKFKAAGVDVRAVWLDWEIEPLAGTDEWQEAKACTRCQAMFPPRVLDDYGAYRAFMARWRVQLFSTYVVAPILEQYPKCSVTNWEAVVSAPDQPTQNWLGTGTMAPMGLGMFTAANPVVYGNTYNYDLHWKEHPAWPMDQAHMDRIYTEVMLGQISGHASNAVREAPEKDSVPWIDRMCADDEDPKIPILTRTRYREILRHIWLRGANGMQIFNNDWFKDARHNIQIEELQDAEAVNDEMLAYRQFLDGGTPMNFAAPAADYDGPIWSGRRLGDEAVVRTFTQAGHTLAEAIAPFPGADPVTLNFPPEGATYLLTRTGNQVAVKLMPGG